VGIVSTVSDITKEISNIRYFPGFDQNSVGFQQSGEIIIRNEWIKGGSPFGEGDVVGMEVNMLKNPRTLHFFVNGIQQMHFITGIPEKFRFCGYLNQEGGQFIVHSLQKLDAPKVVSVPRSVEINWAI
ncbi:MAG: hypothetical protein EZS28_038961, partial [Streblomastix strix]